MQNKNEKESKKKAILSFKRKLLKNLNERRYRKKKMRKLFKHKRKKSVYKEKLMIRLRQMRWLKRRDKKTKKHALPKRRLIARSKKLKKPSAFKNYKKRHVLKENKKWLNRLRKLLRKLNVREKQ